MKKYWLAFLPLLVWACSNTQQAPSEKIASSTEGMVVAGHPLAVDFSARLHPTAPHPTRSARAQLMTLRGEAER